MENNGQDIKVVLGILKQVPLFANLNEDLHRQIIEHIKLMFYPLNYKIFKQGDIGEAMYIIRKGKVAIFHEDKEEGELPKTMAELGPGSFFGEMALISASPRTASAKVLEDLEVFILSKDDFQQLLKSNINLATSISDTVVNRLKENTRNNQ